MEVYEPHPPPTQSLRELRELRGLSDIAQPTFGDGDTEERAPAEAGEVTRTADTRAEEWRARGLERILGPYPGEEELAQLLREFEEAELAMGLAC